MWNYYKDNRSDQQVLQDYNIGKKFEKMIFYKLPFKKYWINSDDKFKSMSEYKPDCFILYDFFWVPVEIKYTQKEITSAELKKNQCDELDNISGYYLQSTPSKYFLVSANDIKRKCKIVIGYCNKECYRIENPPWKFWKYGIS